jgi:hypothetical protein
MSQTSPFENIRWLEPHESPFGFRVLDCRPFTSTMISSTKDPAIAARFSSLRRSNGAQHRTAHVADSVRIPCSLNYPASGGSQDGRLFLAERMEDKWDIFLYDGRLLFSRSWTGDLAYAATVDFGDARAVVTEIETSRPQAEDPNRPARVVDFLVKTHLHRVAAPHPLMPIPESETTGLVLGSFSEFGRWAQFGSFDDTTTQAT